MTARIVVLFENKLSWDLDFVIACFLALRNEPVYMC